MTKNDRLWLMVWICGVIIAACMAGIQIVTIMNLSEVYFWAQIVIVSFCFFLLGTFAIVNREILSM